MKSVTILILLILTATISLSQENNKIFYDDYIECFFDNNSKQALLVYDSINGNLIKSLTIDRRKQKYSWYKIALQETIDGWAKIENIMIAPIPTDSINNELRVLKDKWIKIENLKFNTTEVSISDSLFIPFYTEPDVNSELTCKSGIFLKLTLIETKGFWSKVSFELDGTNYSAWIAKEYYCAYPWTACP
jgi:hypothetical protein